MSYHHNSQQHVPGISKMEIHNEDEHGVEFSIPFSDQPILPSDKDEVDEGAAAAMEGLGFDEATLDDLQVLCNIIFLLLTSSLRGSTRRKARPQFSAASGSLLASVLPRDVLTPFSCGQDVSNQGARGEFWEVRESTVAPLRLLKGVRNRGGLTALISHFSESVGKRR